MTRCSWATTPLSIAYHDEEWGVPVYDDTTFFEFLTLEGAQAGLSWETILRKRKRYHEVFFGFDFKRIARLSPETVERLLLDPGIVRNRLKITSTVSNARAFLAVREQFDSFSEYVWRFVDGTPVVTRRRSPADVPAVTPHAEHLSKDLRARGFKFVGPTIVYAFMQATGLVNDHLADCFGNARAAV